MKFRFLVSLAVIGFTLALHAQKPAPAPALPNGGTPPPEITPRPSVSVSPSALVSPASSPSPSASVSPIPRRAAADFTSAMPTDLRSRVDALSAADVQEALQLLKTHYLKPDALSDSELARATLQGALDRIAPGALLVSVTAQTETNPFYSEIINGHIGYLRLGDLSKNNLDAFASALNDLKEKSVKSAVLDLRATPASSDFESAMEMLKAFCAKGRPLFSLKKTGEKNDRIFSSDSDPVFQGLLVVLVDESDAGAGEIIAVVLRAQTNALIVGEKTAGQAFEFSDLPLKESDLILRVAVGEVTLPDGSAIARSGVKPDIAVPMPDLVKREAMRISREKGVAAVTTEVERARMNEAALVAGRNPELDAIQAAQRGGEKPKSPTLDVQLQRALDLVTTLSVFENKRAQK